VVKFDSRHAVRRVLCDAKNAMWADGAVNIKVVLGNPDHSRASRERRLPTLQQTRTKSPARVNGAVSGSRHESQGSRSQSREKSVAWAC
jgi:hypothetical protein